MLPCESVPVSVSICISVCVCDCVHACLCVCPCVSVTVCVSVLNEGLCPVFIEQQRKHRMGKDCDTVQKSSTEFYRGLSHWHQLTQTTSIINIIVYQAISKCCVQYLWWVSSYKVAFNLYFLFLANDYYNTGTHTHTLFLDQGH